MREPDDPAPARRAKIDVPHRLRRVVECVECFGNAYWGLNVPTARPQVVGSGADGPERDFQKTRRTRRLDASHVPQGTVDGALATRRQVITLRYPCRETRRPDADSLPAEPCATSEATRRRVRQVARQCQICWSRSHLPTAPATPPTENLAHSAARAHAPCPGHQPPPPRGKAAPMPNLVAPPEERDREVPGQTTCSEPTRRKHEPDRPPSFPSRKSA